MMPPWANAIFPYTCTCGFQMTANCIKFVGIGRPPQASGWPEVWVEATCPECHDVIWFKQAVTREASIHAITSFYDALEGERMPSHWPLDKPPDGCPAMETPANARQQVPRPSRRGDQPNTPISEGEIASFKKAMERTSFRRGTKAFQQFMASLGVSVSGPRTSDKPKRKLRRRDDESHGK